MATATQPSPDAPVPLREGPLAGGLHSQAPVAAKRPRVDSVDLLRGIVMVLMLLDHTRDFTHWGAFRYDPLDLTRTTVAIYFTRWITHFCAPIFVFLAGTGAYFQLSRGKTKSELSRFLVKRGLWLVLLEVTVIHFAVIFGYNLGFVFQVIWALGVSMVVLGGLVHLSTRTSAIFGVAMIVLHNAFDGVAVTAWQGPGSVIPSALEKLWIVLHQGGPFPIFGWPSPVIFVAYPLIPWIGVMAAGYSFTQLYGIEPAARQRILVRLGVALTIAFVVIRATNFYGDPNPWGERPSVLFTALSFLNTTKYPPSLLYLLMTLGPGLVALAWFERMKPGRIGSALVTFGRVPLFFYILQWFTAHALGIAFHVIAGKPWRFLVPFTFFNPAPEGAGFPLWVTYVAWVIGLVLLYPVCRWYAGVKARRRDWWLSYL